MATAGHSGVVKTGTSSSPSTVAVGIKTATLDQSADLFDATALSDGQFRKRIQGLKDCQIDVSGDFAGDTANGWADIINSVHDDTDLFVQVLPDGTNGYEWQVCASEYTIDFDASDVISASASLLANDSGGPADVGSP